MPDFRAIAKRMGTSAPPGAYYGYGGQYGYASGSPFGRTRWVPMLPGAKRDWERDAKDVDRNAAVAICLGWLQDNFAQSRLQVGDWKDATTFEPDDAHRLVELLGPEGRPNEDYDADVFWSAAILSWKVDGNVFAIKGRGSGGSGDVEALWWEPHWNVTPWHRAGDPRQISWYYVSRPEGLYPVDPADVVHVRDGVDKFNPMLGCSRLKAVVRSIVGSNDCETYLATLVGAMGGLGAVWSPDGEPIEEDEAIAIGASVRRQTTEENSGRMLALSIPGRIDRVALSPQEMALDTLPDRFEATIAAAMGVNPMVVGLSVGASMRSYANQEEADKQSWNNGLLPMARRFARGLQTQLAPDFGDARAVRFDTSHVPALQKNAEAEANRAQVIYTAGLATKDEARTVVGLPPAGPGRGGDDFAPGHTPGDPGADPNADPGGDPNADPSGEADTDES